MDAIGATGDRQAAPSRSDTLTAWTLGRYSANTRFLFLVVPLISDGRCR